MYYFIIKIDKLLIIILQDFLIISSNNLNLFIEEALILILRMILE
jgi:hypothetical protein